MTKPTGRPRGRPKTKEYVTLMARVPDDLADRARRYAGRKRQTISDVLRDGLLVLLQEEDPYREFVSYMNTETDIASDEKEESPVMMSDTKVDMQGTTPIIVSDINTGTEIASDTKEDQPSIVSDAIPAFDPAKYVLGKLCPRGHDYYGTGQTLLRRSNRHCLACDREKFQERKQAKRAK